MGDQKAKELMAELGCGEREIGFVENLPGAVQQELAGQVKAWLTSDRESVDNAIPTGLAAMPAWIRPFASACLK